jgi:PPOX class probable F420-dependent enzyme
MPSRRELIRMTDAELEAYLRDSRRIILVTIGADGMPHPMPMNYGLDEAGRVVMVTFAKSQKVRNLERDPRATLLVESGTAYHELKSAILFCAVEIVRDPAGVAALMPQVRASDAMAGSLSAPMDEQVRASLAKRVALRFTPHRIVSWDHAKLGGVY